MRLVQLKDRTMKDLLPDRTEEGNKGTFGKISLFAGSLNMAGAAILSCEAALRMGCGMARVVTPSANRVIVQERIPEALLTTYEEGTEKKAAEEALDFADAAVIGPGLSRSKSAGTLLENVLTLAPGRIRGLVIDADAVRLLSGDPALMHLLDLAAEKMTIILTPHAAECAALLHISVDRLKETRPACLREFADSHHVTILCKDHVSLCVTAGSDLVYENLEGTSALAKAGTGDVLTGMCVSILVQWQKSGQIPDLPLGLFCAGAASTLHARAARVLTVNGNERSLLAGDLKFAFDRL
jgi:hydroxyethylthiazole kinase-like uncharacterized protein yjeF